jgi:hypothetical protein
MITEINEDLLNSTEEYILQQNCCTSIKVQGLSEAIAKKWPEANPYKSRIRLQGNWATLESRPKPGSIEVLGNTRKIACLFAQYSHGKPNTLKDPSGIVIDDTFKSRLNWFKECLEKVAELKPKSIAIPYKIGCGLAGGSWTSYYKALQEFSQKYPSIKIVIYRL